MEAALAYVDLNPVRAGLVKRAEEYEWASAKTHSCGCEGDSLVDFWYWERLGLGAEWEQRLAAYQAGDQGELLREATYGGRRFGDEKFVVEMERSVQRPLTRGRPGRKPKAATAAVG